ncbi:Cell division protein FtsL [bacterium HR40]|nr:Cell division protein FtsL [bacterium HR40]
MISRPVLVLAVAVVVAAAAVYHLSYRVDALAAQLAATRERMALAAADLASLRASFAYLTRPQRLATLAAGLGMVPVSSQQVVAVAQIGTARELVLAASPVTVLLPSGGTLELRLRPPLPTGAERLP